MKIDNLDHLLLTVKDIEATCAFYSKAALALSMGGYSTPPRLFSKKRLEKAYDDRFAKQ